MIIVYNNKNGDIYGMVSGRVHDQKEIDGVMTKPELVSRDDISKYVVSYKKLTRVEMQDILEDQVDRNTFKIIKDVKVGEKVVVVPAGMECDDQFADFFTGVENGSIRLYSYKFDLDTNLKIVGIVKK